MTRPITFFLLLQIFVLYNSNIILALSGTKATLDLKNLSPQIKNSQNVYQKLDKFTFKYIQVLFTKEPFPGYYKTSGVFYFKTPLSFRWDELQSNKSYGHDGSQAWSLDNKTGWVNQTTLDPVSRTILTLFTWKNFSDHFNYRKPTSEELNFQDIWKEFKQNVPSFDFSKFAAIMLTPKAKSKISQHGQVEKILLGLDKSTHYIRQMVLFIPNGNRTQYNFTNPTNKPFKLDIFKVPSLKIPPKQKRNK